MVIDNHHIGSSSQVAAGLINPITGHRLNITENFEQYNGAAVEFYRRAEGLLGGTFFHELKQIRRINNAGQADYFDKRLQQEEYRQLLTRTESTAFSNDPFGCAQVSKTAVVDTKELLKRTKEWLLSHSAYSALKIDYSKLNFDESSVTYNEIKAKSVIFCEGYQAKFNPWLQDLPFKLAKGEILTMNMDQTLGNMLSWGNWLVPTSENNAKLGSSFAWNDLQLRTDDAVKEKLLSSLDHNTKYRGTVVAHEVGIRPTTLQRKPFVGKLSKRNNAYCFNGLGSKGCLIAPFFTKLLVDHLINYTVLPKEVTQWL